MVISMLSIQTVDMKTLQFIYLNYMTEDFPDDERRPLEKIIALIKQKRYFT